MNQKFTPCLMFVGAQNGRAEEAINFYVSMFENSRIISVEHYQAGEEGLEGTVKKARVSLNGQEFMAMDSSGAHDFTFTPALSIFVECETENEIDAHFAMLSLGGKVLMELGEYPFSKKFAWVDDRFGVSWQLNLAGS